MYTIIIVFISIRIIFTFNNSSHAHLYTRFPRIPIKQATKIIIMQ